MQFDRLTAGIGKYDFDTEKFQTFDGDFAALHKCCRLFHNLFLVDMIHRRSHAGGFLKNTANTEYIATYRFFQIIRHRMQIDFSRNRNIL